MRSLAQTGPTDHKRGVLSKLLQVLAVALIVLLLTVASAFGDNPNQNIPPSTTVDEDQAGEEVDRDTSDEAETVTMSIDLEEGGVIDIEMAEGDVTIDTWEGDEILLIVERSTKARKGRGKISPRPINVQVSRHGKDVRIAALDARGRRLADGALSFRILMPRSDGGTSKLGRVHDLSKWTSVVFKAVHREAIRWILR